MSRREWTGWHGVRSAEATRAGYRPAVVLASKEELRPTNPRATRHSKPTLKVCLTSSKRPVATGLFSKDARDRLNATAKRQRQNKTD